MDGSQSQPVAISILGTMPLSMMMLRFGGPMFENRVVSSQSPGSELLLPWSPSSLVAKKISAMGVAVPLNRARPRVRGMPRQHV